ncbi:MAG: aminodeoxychorismate synthase component I [Ardenticatenaceae bacterium]|nr:aminodeoxychorismate synthase component I [Ardenticatenaceae bacterium]MCB8987221.1 aminodeoxychorismate synthase component I [Ardenticatenaceae bacterium]
MVIVQDGARWLVFREPVQVITAVNPTEVNAALAEVETAVSTRRLYAAGFLSYEAAAAFGLAVHPPHPDDPPLLWFGLYTAPDTVTTLDEFPPAAYEMGTWQPELDEARYVTAVARIKQHIAAGYTYQVNLTFPLCASFRGAPWGLFRDLAQAQQAQYTAYVDTGRHVVCSVSPELFFRLDGSVLTSKPMKGTAVRGRTTAEDAANAAWLRQSEKNRAENVMIVDMIRNDMGRVAATGSVAVPELFAVEQYPTVLQMTSTVTARTAAGLGDVLRAMYPCASITGAPKVRTMQIIRELEGGPRGVYTGAIGFVAPGRRAQFNVAIRTVVVDRTRETAVYGVGSGVVWDSDPAAEYAECLLKAQVLRTRRPQFDLLESLLWEPDGGYFLLERHVARLLDSATYFDFAVAETAVRAALSELAAELTEACKVRLTLGRNGRIQLATEPLAAGQLPEPVRLGLAQQPVASDNVFLCHKTTHRQVYAAARESRPDCDEVILWNERGELTEAGSSNLVLELDGGLWTPPAACGLLPGTLRAEMLANGRVREKVLYLEDLARASQIYLLNSVRGWRPAEMIGRGK